MLLLISSITFGQKIEGTWIGPKPNINEITVISRGNDPGGMSELLQLEIASRGLRVLTQSNFQENTTINSESVKSKYAITFSYSMANGGWLYTLNVNIYDVEDDGRLLGAFKWKGVRGPKKVIPLMIDEILN